MLVVYELVRSVLELVANQIGVGGIAVGALSVGVVGLYYTRELAGVFVLLARYARVASIVGAALLVVIVGGSYLGVLELQDVGTLVESVAQLIGGGH